MSEHTSRAAELLQYWLSTDRLKPRVSASPMSDDPATLRRRDLAEGIRKVAQGMLDLTSITSGDCVSAFASTGHRDYPWLAGATEMIVAHDWGSVERFMVIPGEEDFGRHGSLHLSQVTLQVATGAAAVPLAQLCLVLPARAYGEDSGYENGYTVVTVTLGGALRVQSNRLELFAGNYIGHATFGLPLDHAVICRRGSEYENVEKALFPGAINYLADGLPRLGTYFSGVARHYHAIRS